MNKKRLIITVISAVVLFALLGAAYILKHNDNTDGGEEPQQKTEYIKADKSAGVAGPVYDSLPEDIWADEVPSGNFTTRAELGSDEESIGVLTIDKIGLTCNVYDSDEDTVMEDMKKGAAHYKSTSYWFGNVGLSAHNGNASYSYFDKLHKLKKGDIISYQTMMGTLQYEVVLIETVADDDWSMLGRTDDNRITLTTCITGKENQRLCVQGVEIQN